MLYWSCRQAEFMTRSKNVIEYKYQFSSHGKNINVNFSFKFHFVHTVSIDSAHENALVIITVLNTRIVKTESKPNDWLHVWKNDWPTDKLTDRWIRVNKKCAILLASDWLILFIHFINTVEKANRLTDWLPDLLIAWLTPWLTDWLTNCLWLTDKT